MLAMILLQKSIAKVGVLTFFGHFLAHFRTAKTTFRRDSPVPSSKNVIFHVFATKNPYQPSANWYFTFFKKTKTLSTGERKTTRITNHSCRFASIRVDSFFAFLRPLRYQLIVFCPNFITFLVFWCFSENGPKVVKSWLGWFNSKNHLF